MRCFWLLWLVLLPAAAPAAEFAAQMLIQEKGHLMPGKIYVKDQKLRQEFLDEKGHTVTIVRRDKRLIWVVLPWENTYVELPLGPHLPGQFLQIPPEATHRRLLGREEWEGYQVERLEVTLPGGVRQTYWVAPKLGLPVKASFPARQLTLEYRNIRERQLEDRLFEIPPGFRKVSGLPVSP